MRNAATPVDTLSIEIDTNNYQSMISKKQCGYIDLWFLRINSNKTKIGCSNHAYRLMVVQLTYGFHVIGYLPTQKKYFKIYDSYVYIPNKPKKLLDLAYDYWEQPNVMSKRLKCLNVENSDIKQWMNVMKKVFQIFSMSVMPDIIPGYIFSNYRLSIKKLDKVILKTNRNNKYLEV